MFESIAELEQAKAKRLAIVRERSKSSTELIQKAYHARMATRALSTSIANEVFNWDGPPSQEQLDAILDLGNQYRQAKTAEKEASRLRDESKPIYSHAQAAKLNAAITDWFTIEARKIKAARKAAAK